jgi:hypothetical protein
METLKGVLFSQVPIIENPVMWIRVTTMSGFHNYLLLFKEGDKDLFMEQAKQDTVVEVTGTIDRSKEWYITHFVVDTWKFE